MGKGQPGLEEEVADLKKQVAKLTSENAQLKKQVAAYQAKEAKAVGAKGEGKKQKEPKGAQPAPRSIKKEEQQPQQQPPQPPAAAQEQQPKEGGKSKRKPKSKKNKEDAELDRLLDDFRTKTQANKAADSSPKKAAAEEANGQKRTRVCQFKNKKEEKLQKGNEEAIKQLQLKHMFSKLNDMMKDGDKNGKGAEGILPPSMMPPSDDSDQ